jgi:hypothetical protein
MRTRILLTITLLAAVGACSGEPPTSVIPETPRMDNGWLGGSGNRTDPQPPADAGTQSTTTTVPCVPADNEDDNGWLGGSGNYTDPVCPEPTGP